MGSLLGMKKRPFLLVKLTWNTPTAPERNKKELRKKGFFKKNGINPG